MQLLVLSSFSVLVMMIHAPVIFLIHDKYDHPSSDCDVKLFTILIVWQETAALLFFTLPTRSFPAST